VKGVYAFCGPLPFVRLWSWRWARGYGILQIRLDEDAPPERKVFRMRFSRSLSLFCCAVLALSMFVACGSGEPAVDEAREAEWASLVEAKGQLDALRQEEADLQELLAAALSEDEEGSEEEPVEGEEAAGAEDAVDALTPEEIQAKLADLETEIPAQADDFMQNLVGYLNADPMIEGEPPTERQIAAIRMKSSEDMVLAQEYIDKGGDYQRAINIYEGSLQVDPDNETLKAALETAMLDRYMSEERFAQAKKGMTQDEIREVLGQVNLYNVREYEDRGVTAWFYPTAEGGKASAVWFRENKRSGQLEAYQIKYDAVDPENDTAE
jgi:hypothetical protein